MKVLLTGGAGYIGCHVGVALLEAGLDVVVVDNLSTSSLASLEKLPKITGRRPVFVEGDIRNFDLLTSIFTEHKIDAVIHLAALKSTEESVLEPIRYYANNIGSSLALLKAMDNANLFTLVFSSSATVYGQSLLLPISESNETTLPSTPYGRSKLMVEQFLFDIAVSDPRWRIAILRYFNPVGAHESGLIGEDPAGLPNNLFPHVAQVAAGKIEELKVFGADYPTLDGSGVRDYVHVMDVAHGHLRALNVLSRRRGANVWNLGTGRGYSVFEVLSEFRRVTGKTIPFKVFDRRKGDVAVSYADPSKANRELEWLPTRGLTQMIEDTWRWQINNT